MPAPVDSPWTLGHLGPPNRATRLTPPLPRTSPRRPTGIRFEPVKYSLDGNHIWSNVKFKAPFGITGWLSAAGTLVARPDGDSVEVVFSEFWIDYGENSLRPDVTQAGGQGGKEKGPLDSVITQMGRMGFFPALSVYPVLYLDEDLCVFKFVPLDSTIACRRVGPVEVPDAMSWTIDPEGFDNDV